MNKTELEELRWSIHPKIKSDEKNAKEAIYLNTIIRKVSHKTKKKYITMLDIPCGEGRLDGYFRKFGYAVYGIDINPIFIKRAKEEYPKYSSNYSVANMKSFHSSRKFDIILCWFTSFGYLNEKDNVSALKNFSKYLNIGGLLILEVPNKEEFAADKQKHYGIDESPNFLRLVTSFTIRKGNKLYMLHTSKLYGKVGKDLKLIKHFKQPIRLYKIKEMTRLLDKVGIKVKNKFGRMSLKSDTKSRFITFVGIKSR